ncbi:MAG: hypothetical protein LHV68_08810 [Elusimicrobia bacterium]|nr:hypothetical protein [Candidatus Liberimonas magnetica]
MYKKISVLFLLVILAACASTPKQSAMLSQELSGMIRNCRAAHIALLDEYLVERRNRIDDFMKNQWIPKFMENFTKNKDKDVVKELNKAKDEDEKYQIIQEFGESASKRIEERRTALVDALSDIGKSLRVKIEDHYDQMEAVNETLTAHLRSAEKVNATRDELLKTINMPLNRIIPFDKLNKTLDKISVYEGKIEDLGTLVQDAKQTFVQEGSNGK